MVCECGEGAKHIICQAEGLVVALRKACSPLHIMQCLAWKLLGFAHGAQ